MGYFYSNGKSAKYFTLTQNIPQRFEVGKCFFVKGISCETWRLKRFESC
jgi:hypothetical protein